MTKLYQTLNDKLYTMASDLEVRLTKKLSQMVDKRLSSEITKLKDIHSRINKDDLYEYIKDLEDRIEEIR